MKTTTIEPLPALRTKFMLWHVILFTIFLLAVSLFHWPIILEEGVGAWISLAIFIGLDFIYLILALVLAGPYFRSLKYEIHEDEVIVYAGIWTRSVKHVPFRTITNITVKRDILDRLLNVGSLNIQTAGISGKTTPEEKLGGLEDVQQIYETVAGKLRQFRSAMSPTSADMEKAGAGGSEIVLQAILEELKGIRETLQKDE